MKQHARAAAFALFSLTALPLAAWRLPWPLRPPGTPHPEKFAERITAASALATVEQLASPEYAGRLTGTGGFESAAHWMAAECRNAGLQSPDGIKGCLQPFDLKLGGLESAAMELLPANDTGAPEVQEFFKGFMPMLQSASGDVTAEVVFAGYGITASDFGRDDYAGLKAEGKVVMVLRGEPKDGRDWKGHNTTAAREAEAKAHGAVAFLLVDHPVLSASGSPIPGLPAAMVSEALASEILSGQKVKLNELGKLLEKGETKAIATGRRVHFKVVAREVQERQGFNIVGILPGKDKKLEGECVVLGTHLDHVGSWPALFPGADDNASGSAALLEIARAITKVPQHPRRSIVFVWFGGEEVGLLGSEYFSKHLPVGLGRPVAVLNLDMVGAGDGAWVAGGKNFPEIFKALESARDLTAPDFKLVAGESKGEARADHGPFQAMGMHAVSLFGSGGSHHGYHTPEDTCYFITPKTMESVGRIVMTAAWDLADAQ